jgi:hypothetical protein
MSGGRASVGPRQTQAAKLLASFNAVTGDSDDEEYDNAAALDAISKISYDKNDPWSSPRGSHRETTPPLARHNFCPGITDLARKLRQRSIYTGNFKMSRQQYYFFENAVAAQPPSRVEQLVSQARSLSSLGFAEPEKKGSVRPKTPVLPKLTPTPRLARKLALLGLDDWAPPALAPPALDTPAEGGDAVQDPGEMKRLSASMPSKVAELRGRLAELRRGDVR